MSNTIEIMTNLYIIIGIIIVGIFVLVALINAVWEIYQRIVGVKYIHKALNYYKSKNYNQLQRKDLKDE